MKLYKRFGVVCRWTHTTSGLEEDYEKRFKDITGINKRLFALENKQPTYVSPPVIGPTKQYCGRCGNYVDINHICYGR
jgi:5-methylcytosine-specific restriction endonuclease McrA